jgi:lipoic acid synthetase
MVGIGERPEEVYETLEEIRAAGVEVMTLGQYMQPTPKHLPVDRWVHPDEFDRYRRYALDLGFLHCEAGPLVRSSYHAHEHVGSEREPSAGAASTAPAPPSGSERRQERRQEKWQPLSPSI